MIANRNRSGDVVQQDVWDSGHIGERAGLITRNGVLAEGNVYEGYGPVATWGYRAQDFDRNTIVNISDIIRVNNGSNGANTETDDPATDADLDGDTDSEDVTAVSSQYYQSGNIDLHVSSVGNPFRFTGRRLHYLDDLTQAGANDNRQLQYSRARHYDPKHGRWLQRDPIEYADGMNSYEYLRARPGVWLDPSGTKVVCECAAKQYIDENSVTGYEMGDYPGAGDAKVFKKGSGAVEWTEGDLTSEIIGTMIKSQRIFLIKDFEVEEWKNHVRARSEIVSAAESAAFGWPSSAKHSMVFFGYEFWKERTRVAYTGRALHPPVLDPVAIGSPFAAIADIWARPDHYRMTCAPGAAAVYLRGISVAMGKPFDKLVENNDPFRSLGVFALNAPTGDGSDWVPADWGFIRNSAWGEGDHGNLAGENIIFLGGGDRYWGHGPWTVRIRPMMAWTVEVATWGGVPPILSNQRLIPRYGLESVFD